MSLPGHLSPFPPADTSKLLSLLNKPIGYETIFGSYEAQNIVLSMSKDQLWSGEYDSINKRFPGYSQAMLNDIVDVVYLLDDDFLMRFIDGSMQPNFYRSINNDRHQASTTLEYQTSLKEHSGCFEQRGVPDIIAAVKDEPEPLGLCYLNGSRKLVSAKPFPLGGYLLGFAHMNASATWLCINEPEHPSSQRLVKTGVPHAKVYHNQVAYLKDICDFIQNRANKFHGGVKKTWLEYLELSAIVQVAFTDFCDKNGIVSKQLPTSGVQSYEQIYSRWMLERWGSDFGNWSRFETCKSTFNGYPLPP